jgi:hypothetical protein
MSDWLSLSGRRKSDATKFEVVVIP